MYYNKDIKEIIKELNTKENGLSSYDARKRLLLNGLNLIDDKGKISKLKLFLKQFKNLMIILLIIVGVLSLIYDLFNNGDFLEPIVILGTSIINVLMGYFQESKAENALEKLKKYTVTKVNVRRDGKMHKIISTKLVKGDIIVLESGDQIPADCRIIEDYYAKVDESLLTGESVPVDKDNKTIIGQKSLHEISNMVFAGTNIVAGKVIAVVVETAMNTQMGKIASKLVQEKEETSLEAKVKKISSFISNVAIVLVMFVLCFGLIKGYDLMTVVMLCISMIVASVPESLPIAITSTLSVGVSSMAKKKTIVRNMSAIETLGGVNIIATDKTGTITTNKMEVIKIFTEGKIYLSSELSLQDYPMMLNTMALCNTASLNKKNIYSGDSVDVALADYLKDQKIKKETIARKNRQISEMPFDSDRKKMSSINKIDQTPYIFTKGSLEAVLNSCTKILINNKEVKLTTAMKNEIKKAEKEFSKDALKTVALAYKKLNQDKNYKEENYKEESQLTFIGFIGLKDPARKDVKGAIKECMEAGIRPIMITGDNLQTALAIAKEVGIVNDDLGIEGDQLDKMTHAELKKCLKKYNVFARVTPEHKYVIIEELKRQGNIVAMTGDGVNDAPALKKADVGVGMGKGGTDVTKNVSDILLLDDSFKTIVTASSEGRRIYDNILLNILYNLSSNFTEIIIIIFGMILSYSIIGPIHVLYIDLVADTIPSIALAFEKASKDNMKRKPTKLKQPIFTKHFISFLITSIIIEVTVTLIVYYYFIHYYGPGVAQTLALLSIIINEFVFAYNCRSIKEPIYKRGFFSNKYLNLGILFLIIVQLCVFLTPIGKIFNLVPINFYQMLFVIFINGISFVIIEWLKPILNKYFKE